MGEDHIEVVPYDPAWPEAFARERRAVVSALGPLAEGLAIEHTGSTAVPGLMAKPTIDLIVGAPAPGVAAAAVAALERAGYRHMGEHGIPGRHFFRKGLPPTHHLHWVERGGDFWDRVMLFRDHLRTHPADCDRYEWVKRGLATRFERERERYTQGKNDVVAEILARAQAARRARRIIVDLEATCWETGHSLQRQEIIEIGAVEMGPDLQLGREFSQLVRPEREPELSRFCASLTGITQAEVDAAPPFPAVFQRFLDWIGTEPFELCSWSVYDLNQFRVELERRNRTLPPGFEPHVDLRALEARRSGAGPSTMVEACRRWGLTLDGRLHRGVDDARNGARLLRLLIGPDSA